MCATRVPSKAVLVARHYVTGRPFIYAQPDALITVTRTPTRVCAEAMDIAAVPETPTVRVRLIARHARRS